MELAPERDHDHLDYRLNCAVCRRRYPVSVCMMNPPLGEILLERIERSRVDGDWLEVHALAVEVLIEHGTTVLSCQET